MWDLTDVVVDSFEGHLACREQVVLAQQDAEWWRGQVRSLGQRIRGELGDGVLAQVRGADIDAAYWMEVLNKLAAHCESLGSDS